jgi:hypothetical protein
MDEVIDAGVRLLRRVWESVSGDWVWAIDLIFQHVRLSPIEDYQCDRIRLDYLSLINAGDCAGAINKGGCCGRTAARAKSPRL